MGCVPYMSESNCSAGEQHWCKAMLHTVCRSRGHTHEVQQCTVLIPFCQLGHPLILHNYTIVMWRAMYTRHIYLDSSPTSPAGLVQPALSAECMCHAMWTLAFVFEGWPRMHTHDTNIDILCKSAACHSILDGTMQQATCTIHINLSCMHSSLWLATNPFSLTLCIYSSIKICTFTNIYVC